MRLFFIALWRLFDTYILRVIPLIKQFREMQDRNKSNLKLKEINSGVDELKITKWEEKKQKKYNFLLKEILEKKVFDKEELMDLLKGKYFILVVFAFPRFPNELDKKTKKRCEKFLVNNLTKKGIKNKRLYSQLLEEDLKFQKFGYSYYCH